MTTYNAELKCKDGNLYIGIQNYPHCSWNCSQHDYKHQPVEYSFPITKNYACYLDSYLTGLQKMNVKKSIKYLKGAILDIQKDSKYGAFSDSEEADYWKATPKHAILALTHLMDMADECVDTTCEWNIKEV